jgi:nucleoside-diphosphate-sugar epimerase
MELTMDRTDQPLALVIGATGGVGGAVAERLLAAGWRVRAMNRDPDAARTANPALEWLRGDAMVEADVIAAAADAQVIVHGANPPAYRNWAGLQMPMLRNTIAAARAVGARIAFPGTVYNFGPDAFPLIAETAPQHPVTRKGKIRVQMEAALEAASRDGVRVLIVRAGDFFGPKPGNNWLSQGIVAPGKPLRAITYPGPKDIAHCWGYLPDVAETMVRLIGKDAELAPFAVFHMRGHTQTGEAMAAALARVAGRRLSVRALPWLFLRLAAPFNETLREMLEMRYLWREPVLLDNAKLVAALGEEPHTPLDRALRTALLGLNIPLAVQKTPVRGQELAATTEIAAMQH